MKIKQFLFCSIGVSLLLASCQKNEIYQDGQQLEDELLLTKTELAYPDTEGSIHTLYYGLTEVTVEKINDTYVLDGDIVFALDQLTTTPSNDENRSVGRTGGRWPNNIVHYSIDPNLPNQQRVIDAIAHWENNTAIEFVQRTNQSSYVYFKPGGGCSSFVGKIGGKQDITLASGCSTGSTIHEIGHAIGLWHEQSRIDRDNYITVNFQNIQQGRAFNFQTYAQQGQDGDEYTSALDFNSIMLYSSYAFSANGQPTIVRTNGSTYNTQRNGLSTGDIQGVNIMYPGGGTGGGNTCDGVSAWSSSQNYQQGDRVTYQGNLYERTATSWVLLGPCEAVTSDICDGVSPWSNTQSYSQGDRVTYQGNLYERTATGWSLIGACG
ncbi:M12 family metallopeptidase [uncultured Lacinutrix sp.]|uniref:M12 family metallopeptidase n=1 Tax=uncultured Lacinutrix sp. TaxID=574032 RepID=UPI002612EEC1|nr:M12 family metallopeptidase [uncultured Lacinutrix sp.]